MGAAKQLYAYGEFTIPLHWFDNGYKEGMDPDEFLKQARIWKLKNPKGEFYHEGYSVPDWWGSEAGANTYLYTDAKYKARHSTVKGVVPWSAN